LLSFAADAQPSPLEQKEWKRSCVGERQMEGWMTDRDMKAKKKMNEWAEECTG